MIVFPEHTLERMEGRGASRHVQTEFTYTLPYEYDWNGTYHEHKKLTVHAVDDDGDWIVVSVISRY
jgi:hypothetical protein